MSEATASQEPSMEEILASIRRIISEEGTEQPGGDALAPLAAIPLDSAPVPTAKAKPAPVPIPTPTVEEDDDDDLVLTEVVTASDGGQNNVVPLKPEARIEPLAELPAMEPGVEPEIDDDIEFALDEPIMPEPPAAPKAKAGSRVEPEQAAPKPAAKPASSNRGWADPEGTPAPMTDIDEFAQMTEELPDLVAPEVATAATASFAQLLQPSRKTSEAAERPTGDGLLVETLVRMAVEPMLKAWLDEHLEPIVERIVKREVERLSRKAELG